MEETRNPAVSHLEALPADIHFHILEHLPLSSQLSWRLASPYLSHSATLFVFRRLRLSSAVEPFGPSTEPSFLSIAASDTLSQNVRHVTLDLDLPLSHRGRRLLAAKPSDGPDIFLRALPKLNRFRRLRTLQIRFSKFCGNRGEHLRGPLEPEETNEYRYLVLDIVFHCLAGLWTEARQAELDAYLNGDAVATAVIDANAISSERKKRDITSLFNTESDNSPAVLHQSVNLDALTIINLADSNDPRITSSPAFQRILSLKTLRTLKLLVTFETSDASNAVTQFHNWGLGGPPQPANVEAPAKYPFLASLPATWLRPSIAANLRTLMLYCGNYWGWCPKFDPRTINPQLGDGGGLPGLRVLGLGNFVFSHAWQAEWIAGLGRGGAGSGLEELYLDDCPIMWLGRIHGPLDQSVTELAPSDGIGGSMEIGDDNGKNDGTRNPLRISNEGYPRTDITTTSTDPRLTMYENPTRWHTVLALWRKHMTGLKVFGMGSGTFDSVSHEIGPSENRPSEANRRAATQVDDQTTPASPASTSTQSTSASSVAPLAAQEPAADGATLLGTERRRVYSWGMSTKRGDVLQYIRYEGCLTIGPWFRRDFRPMMIDEYVHGLKAYEAVRRRDEVALEGLIATVEGRR